jgi:hypothetical protein
MFGPLLTLVLLGGSAYAQGSRKDDVVFNAQGRPMAGASVRVCTSAATGQPCSPLASIYSDAALTQALANPLSADGLGNYNFYAAPGRYEIEISGPGIITKQIPNVILPSDPSTPTFTSVTTTSGISAFSLTLAGNLTVNGSASVLGSLTVGGAPVPSTNADNQWTTSQRFKGPIPWRDVSAYMPAGGCASSDVHSPGATTGAMSSGSPTLTVANARDFKNGCGLAIAGAGPASSEVPPAGAANISAIARSSNTVTVTCATACGLDLTAAWPTGLVVSGVAGGATSFNGTFALTAVPDSTHFQYAQTGANESGTASTGAFTALWGYAHGVAGSTTYKYKIVSVDASMGYSAASAQITIANGNASLSTSNYNWITWNPVPAVMYWIYSDKGLGGALTCVGTSFTTGYSDFGLPYPCTADAPVNPPSSAGHQNLYTTVVAGGGTTTLTLAANSGANISGANIYEDISTFLNSCIQDVKTDLSGPLTGGYGCMIPSGTYFLNGPFDYRSVGQYQMKIRVAGALTLQSTPIFSVGGAWEGIGGGSGGTTFEHQITDSIVTGQYLPAVFVWTTAQSVSGAGTISGFNFINVVGDGIFTGYPPLGFAGTSGLRVQDVSISMSTPSAGAPIHIDSDTIGVWLKDVTLIPDNTAGAQAAISVTVNVYGGNVTGLVYANNLSTNFRGIKFSAPGVFLSGGGHNSYFIDGWIHESLLASEKALIVLDNGSNAPMGSSPGAGIPVNGITIHALNNSDPAGGPAAHTLFQITTYPGQTFNAVSLDAVNSFGSMLSCAVYCDQPTIPGYFSLNSAADTTHFGSGLSVASNVINASAPLKLTLNNSAFGSTPPNPAWAQALPPPNQFQVTSTAAGGLSAGTYCMVVAGKDAQTSPGTTLPSPEVCQTVGASSSIHLFWQQAGGVIAQSYSGFRLYYGLSAGNEANYLDLPAGADPYNYTFTSTAGNVAGAPPTQPTAYLSWLYWEHPGCFYCTSAGAGASWPLGVGEPNPAAGVKLAVKGGTIQGEGGIQAGTDTAFNASPRGSYNAFLPNLTSSAATYQRMTLDKAITVTRLQLVLGTAGAGCSTQSTVSVTDGTNSVTLTTANGTAIYDSGAVSQNFAGAANLDVKIVTAAGGCSTAPQNANVTAEYRMQ